MPGFISERKFFVLSCGLKQDNVVFNSSIMPNLFQTNFHRLHFLSRIVFNGQIQLDVVSTESDGLIHRTSHMQFVAQILVSYRPMNKVCFFLMIAFWYPFQIQHQWQPFFFFVHSILFSSKVYKNQSIYQFE